MHRECLRCGRSAVKFYHIFIWHIIIRVIYASVARAPGNTLCENNSIPRLLSFFPFVYCYVYSSGCDAIRSARVALNFFRISFAVWRRFLFSLADRKATSLRLLGGKMLIARARLFFLSRCDCFRLIACNLLFSCELGGRGRSQRH